METNSDYKLFCKNRYLDIYVKSYDQYLQGKVSENAKKTSERSAQHDAMLITFQEAYDKFSSDVNAAQVWNAIYNIHLHRKAKIDNLSELNEEIIDSIISGAQSWKKCSGHVFEDYIVQSTAKRLMKYHVRFVLQKELAKMLREEKIGNESEDQLEELVRSDDFDIYALVDFNEMNYVFGCIQAKTSIRDRVGRDRDFSIPVMERHFWSVAVALDGTYLAMPKFEHMVNGGGDTQYRENGWHGMYVMSNVTNNDRIYYDKNLDLLIEDSRQAAKKFVSARQRFDRYWKAIRNNDEIYMEE